MAKKNMLHRFGDLEKSPDAPKEPVANDTLAVSSATTMSKASTSVPALSFAATRGAPERLGNPAKHLCA